MIHELKEFELHGQLPLARYGRALRLPRRSRTADDLRNLVLGRGRRPAAAVVKVGAVVIGDGGRDVDGI